MSQASKPTFIDIGVSVQMGEGALLATWAFANEANGSDANRVSLDSGQEYRVTYQLSDASTWSLAALSLRRVPSSNTGFATLEQGQTTQPLQLPEGAGTIAIEVFTPEKVTLCI
ncbi:MAG TPA: hypothetical protein VLQ93_02725, partial [Myxococcaceae bacterium]|nr:hypothetical protein [Myxococcaceae bacterium]